MKRKRLKKGKKRKRLCGTRRKKREDPELSKKIEYGDAGDFQLSKKKIKKNGAIIRGNKNEIYGKKNQIIGDCNIVYGDENIVNGNKNDIVGNTNIVSGNENNVLGNYNKIKGYKNNSEGIDNIDETKDGNDEDVTTISRTIVITNDGQGGSSILRNMIRSSIFNDDDDDDGDGDIQLPFGEFAPMLSAMFGIEPKKKKDNKIKIKTPNGKSVELKESEMINENGEISKDVCKVCLTNKKNTIIIDCGHIVMCADCAREILKEKDKKCPMCRAEIKHGINDMFDV